MDESIERALAKDRTIDITTQGRRSGEPRRLEIWFHQVDGRVYITGLPGRRGWYANLLAEPHFTFHLKESVQADLEATATPITDDDERRRILTEVTQRVGRTDQLERWLTDAPLVEVDFAEPAP